MTVRAAAALLAAPAALVLVWLTVTAAPLGADTAVVASCSTDGVSLSYDTRYDAALRTHVAVAVDVSSISPACVGKRLELNVAPLGAHGTTTAAAVLVAGSSTEVPLEAPVPVSSPMSVSVLVAG